MKHLELLESQRAGIVHGWRAVIPWTLMFWKSRGEMFVEGLLR